MKKIKFLVELENPGCPINALQHFVQCAIITSCDRIEPLSPLHRLNRRSVKVALVNSSRPRDDSFIRKALKNREFIEGLFRQVDL